MRTLHLHRSIRRAFSLVELLVAIGIIALLIALTLPALRRVLVQSRTAKCAANLRAFGQAAGNFRLDRGARMPASGWSGIVVGYVHKDSLVCPELDLAFDDAIAANKIDYTLNAYIHIRDTNYNVACAPGPFCRVSRTSNSPYTLHVDMEDQAAEGGGDMSFGNAVFDVVQQADGSWRVVEAPRGGAYTIDLIDSATGKNLLTAIGMPGGDQTGASKPCTVSPPSNYAFNRMIDTDAGHNQAEAIYGKADKILAMDFLAVSPQDNSALPMTIDPYGIGGIWPLYIKNESGVARQTYLFARHNRAANILYGDGHVDLQYMDASARSFDPSVTNNLRLWISDDQ